jgi:hypothetical protein
MKEVTITYNMVEAVQAQTELFTRLIELVQGSAVPIFGKKVILQRNFWGGWNYRSVLLKIALADGSEPEGSYPFNWKIDFHHPTRLVFEDRGQDPAKPVLTLDLAAEFYFGLDDDEKEKCLQNFVNQALLLIKPTV